MLKFEMFRKPVWLAALVALGIVILIQAPVRSVQGAAIEKPDAVITVDVAQNMVSFVPGQAPLHADGSPAYGNHFVIEGFLYPEGTLDASNGIVIRQDEAGNPIAEPEFPDKVIGRWTCRGWFVGDGLHTVDAPWAITTQLFAFGESDGGELLVSEGYEIPFGLDASIHRAITGGTGEFANAGGEQVQRLVGINATQAANFRIEFRLARK